MQILDNGIASEQGEFAYLWFSVIDDLGQPKQRAIALRELTVLALDEKEIEDMNMVGKQTAAVRGLYNAGVDFVYLAAGIFKPQHVGVIQFYGAAADGPSREIAGQTAMAKLRAVQANLANYQQSQTRAPLMRWIEWYLDFVTVRASHALAILGHPDPRDARRGVNLDALQASTDDLAAEQNELLFRGLVKLEEDFVFQVTADRLGQRYLADSVVEVDRKVSVVASRRKGAISIGASLSVPIMAALSNSLGAGTSNGQGHGQTVTDGQSQGWGQGHTASQSHTESRSGTVSESVTDGIAVTHSEGRAVMVGETVTNGVAQTSGQATTTGHSSSSSSSQGGSQSASHSVGNTTGASTGGSTSSNWNNSLGGSVGGGAQAGIPGVIGGSVNASVNASAGQGGGETQSGSLSSGHSENSATAQSSQWSASQSQGSSRSQTNSQSQTTSHAEGHSRSLSLSEADSITESHSETKGKSFTSGSADMVGKADSVQQSFGQSHAAGQSQTQSQSQSASSALTRGLSSGIIPGISIGRSWQTEDHVADRLANVLKQVSDHFNDAAVSGGFLAEAVIFTASKTGATAAEALVPQAFHGPNAPTPVLTVQPEGDDLAVLRQSALTFIPTRLPQADDFLSGLLGGKYSTVITPQQVAAYTAPAIFRDGTVRIIPAIPKDGLGFYPAMQGEVLLGHQFSPETADLTNAPVLLNKARFMHFMWAGSTGFGKSVGAQRMVYEMRRQWGMKIIVMDFGAGWRRLLNAPGIEADVDIRQLTPYGVRPLRWNPLQISRYIVPEIQMRSFVDIFANLSQLGEKQQKHRFFDTVEATYQEYGVLVNDPAVLNDPLWGQVSSAEAVITGLAEGTRLRQLTIAQRQPIAVLRSKAVGLQAVFDKFQAEFNALPARDQVGRGILYGIMERMKTLLRGAMAAQFGPGDDSLDVATLGEEGITILEGGTELDAFTKAWLLSWSGWIIYTDRVKQREMQLVGQDADLTIVFEEANIIFTGLSGENEDGQGAGQVSEQYDNMFRDSRKYGIRFVLITQSPSLIPPGVRDSCSSVGVGYLAGDKDKDVALAAIAKSSSGFKDVPWKRFLGDEGIGMMLGRLPYTMDRSEMRPFLFRPLLLQAKEPSNAEIAQKLGSIVL